MTTDDSTCLVLRLAGPLQSWGSASQFNRRATAAEPTKSGIVGLLAAAQGRRRSDPIEDLVGLRLAVRTDRGGSLLRDYHTVSDYRNQPLPSARTGPQGRQRPTSPAKNTAVTQRFYLQDAVFVAALAGPTPLLEALAEALTRPQFPLALGRRSCPPTQPLLLRPPPPGGVLWPGPLDIVLTTVPWQAAPPRNPTATAPTLPVTLDDPNGSDLRPDTPTGFDHHTRAFTTRRVRQVWVTLVNGDEPTDAPAGSAPAAHDPFALLGW